MRPQVSYSLVITFVVLALVFAGVAREYSSLYALSGAAAVAIYCAFSLLLAFALYPAWHGRRPEQKRLRWSEAVVVPLWCTPYLFYAAGTGDFRWAALLKLAAVAALPVALYIWLPPRKPETFAWQDAAVASMFIGFVLTGQLRGIWNVPVNLDFMTRLFLIAVAAWCWTRIRPVPRLGYSFRVSREVAKQAVINFALFAAIAIPSGLAIHFIRWNPRWPGAVPFLLSFLQIFLFIAVLEELFFRGFLQSLLSVRLRSWIAGQVVVSVIFGLFHIFHAPFPNWRYVALATVAGWFYGSAWRVSGSLMASSIVHAAVDTIWRTWFSAR